MKHSDSQDWNPPRVVLVGMGMGREDVGASALRWIERAEVLAGGGRHLDWFPDLSCERIPLQGPLNDWLDQVGRVSIERRTVVLASGDPFFFGVGRRLADRVGKENLLTFPNITSVQVLFSRLNEPWEDVKVMSLHGRGPAAENPEWLEQLRHHSKVVFFTDPQHTPDWIARQLLDAAMKDRTLVVGEDLGLPSEKIQRFFPEEAAARKFSPLNLVAVLDESPSRQAVDSTVPQAVLGLPETAFRHRAGLITKMEVRAVALAHLQLRPGLVLWDLGAGSGSVSIEASRLVPLRRVVAVEKDAERYRDLQDNVKRLQGSQIETVHGKAAQVLDALPDPDRVFIGGSGGDLREIFENLLRRMRPGGRVVVTAATLDTLEAVRAFWSDKPYEMQITQLQVSRSVPIGKTVRFEALNPVFVVSVWPKPI
ncbi:precorrin-6y C5,15-methyltransferase (decarboxylating) subunit CbiE [Desulforhabdus amnigena]|jgi:precorrin-6Y C5,15-methyltransferase (decarboxylating)|uniref:Precorrin-6Y-methylase n=1 Tax=Desulforhabdus amnigena TaxID=40218 RepID=A0A9W6FUG2_9BACT|nr:precorrin-6y C5,15-methyltransferase (decarboxylating) subunit CbiE [Desulforhabdus amnigena]NLJ27570.1 precorrin-6y C5,15-methyltransferase (decarboxylating) subunit CbiE [Deltaproteobacteria bacterium]GLI35094.1 precorrin-6Y-methylase [Desulforhabdus amnigena]